MKVSQDFMDLVKKSLSQNSVEVVQGLLNDSKELEAVKKDLSEYQQRYSEVLNENKALGERNNALEATAAKVAETERNQEVFKANLERDAAKGNAAMLFKLVDKIFSNRVICDTLNESITNQESTAYDGQGHSYTCRTPIGKHTERTQEIQ